MIDRYDFADAIMTFACYRDHTLIDRLASKASKVSALSNMGWPHKQSRRRRGSNSYETTERQAVQSLEPGAALAYLALVAKNAGESEAIKLANEIHRINRADGVTIQLETSDDDPTQFTAHIADELADEWCEAHGALDGGTWECADGPDFCYDILYWRPRLIEELQKEGFDFDFSQFSEPDERDIAVAMHASECSECEYDWHKANDHLVEIEAEPLFNQAAIRGES